MAIELATQFQAYDTDKDGNFLPSVPDRDNHTCDATAYSLDRLIFNKNEGA